MEHRQPPRAPSRPALLAVVCLSALLLCGLVLTGWDGDGGRTAVMQVDAPYPTETKTQSKLWFAHGAWWAWLPDGEGSSVWRRGDEGWNRQTHLDGWLRRAPGFADVLVGEGAVWAALVWHETITVARLDFDAELDSYRPGEVLAYWELEPGRARTPLWKRAVPTSMIPARPVESVTLARGAEGRLWVVYDHDYHVQARVSDGSAGRSWGEPISVSEPAGPIAGDDVGLVVAMSDGIGVAWSDQRNDRFLFRHHPTGDPDHQWSDVETIASGQGTVNDHLNAALDRDGHLYVVTKTSRYEDGEPMLLLNVRDVSGAWLSLPYAPYREGASPTRPLVLACSETDRVHLVHTVIDQSRRWLPGRRPNRIELYGWEFGSALSPQWEESLIADVRDVRNATSTKQPLGMDEHAVVLASDRWGRVFEGTWPAFRPGVPPARQAVTQPSD